MPNWCATSYVFESKDKYVLERFYNFVIKYTSNKYALIKYEDSPFSLGNMWLGNLLNGCKVEFGATNEEIKTIYCRGTITYLFTNEEKDGYLFERDCHINDDVYILELETETAWTPMLNVWNFILKYFPDITYYYKATEPGCGIYATNDVDHVYFDNDYHVLIEVNDCPALSSFLDAFYEYNHDGLVDESFPSEVLQFLLRKALNIQNETYDIDKLISMALTLFEGKEGCYFDIDKYTERGELY